MSLDQHLELFFGLSSDASTHVYARAPRPRQEDVKLVGRITGPFCGGVRTLPMTVPFTDLGKGPTLLARAVVPDLCPWLPDQPHLYRVLIELVAGQGTIDRAERQWSAHRFGTKDRNFVWNANRWVIRGVRSRYTHQRIESWHDHDAALVADDPDQALCENASQLGVPLIAVITDQGNTVEQLAFLARWPAVLIAVVSCALPADFEPKTALPNLVVATQLIGDVPIPGWAQAVFCDETELRSRIANHAALPNVPVVATRTTLPNFDVGQARAECDHLQRDLASFGQFAGYVVW